MKLRERRADRDGKTKTLQSPSITYWCHCKLFHRFTCSLIYYALAFNTGTLHGDIYVNTFIAGAVEIPAYFLSMVLMDWKPMGRKWTGCLSLIISAISSFLCIPMLIFGQHINFDWLNPLTPTVAIWEQL